MSTATIVDLVTVCERMAATNRALFEVLGSWVADEPEPSVQQWFAEACHRHAWHADLWEARRPTVPIDPEVPFEPDDAPTEPGGRVAWYKSQLESLHQELATLESQLDKVLDPSTERVVRLIEADLEDLADRAPA